MPGAWPPTLQTVPASRAARCFRGVYAAPWPGISLIQSRRVCVATFRALPTELSPLARTTGIEPATPALRWHEPTQVAAKLFAGSRCGCRADLDRSQGSNLEDPQSHVSASVPAIRCTPRCAAGCWRSVCLHACPGLELPARAYPRPALQTEKQSRRESKCLPLAGLRLGLNQRPIACEAIALPAELRESTCGGSGERSTPQHVVHVNGLPILRFRPYVGPSLRRGHDLGRPPLRLSSRHTEG